MSLICLVMINTESNLTLNFNGSVLTGATQRGKEEAQNILGEGGLGWPRHSRLSILCAPPATINVLFGGLAEGKSPWRGSAWGWGVVGTGTGITQSSQGSPKLCSTSKVKALFKKQTENWGN